jgi:steroid 5-alpha reductase family enzyme
MISKLVKKTTQLVIFESNEDTILKYFLQMQNVEMYLVTLRRQCAIQGMSQGISQMGERNRIQETIEYTMMVVEMKVMHQMVLFMFHPQNFGNIQSK